MVGGVCTVDRDFVVRSTVSEVRLVDFEVESPEPYRVLYPISVRAGLEVVGEPFEAALTFVLLDGDSVACVVGALPVVHTGPSDTLTPISVQSELMIPSQCADAVGAGRELAVLFDSGGDVILEGRNAPPADEVNTRDLRHLCDSAGHAHGK